MTLNKAIAAVAAVLYFGGALAFLALIIITGVDVLLHEDTAAGIALLLFAAILTSGLLLLVLWFRTRSK